MAVSTKKSKKPRAVKHEESDQSDELESESGEELGDDMVEPMIEVHSDDSESDIEDTIGLTSGPDLEVKEEVSSEHIPSDEDSESENEEAEFTNSKEKRVRIATENSDESDSDTDQEGKDESSGEEGGSDIEDSKSGLAHVMAEILKIPGGNNLILSKAKKDHMVNRAEDTGEFEFVDEEGNVKQEVKVEVVDEEDEDDKARIKQRLKNELVLKYKSRPNFEIDREKERQLRIVATQGVVQLFTAIAKHKAQVKKDKSNTKSIIDRDEYSSSEMKASFLNILDKEGEKLERSNPLKNAKRKSEVKDEEPKKPKWNVFADNFYKEPTLQGWDLKSDDEEDPL